MKKKIIITLLLSLICAFGAMFTVACSSTGSNGSENLNGEVTAPVENTDDAIKKLQQQIADLQAELKNLSDKIGKLENENESLATNIKRLEAEIQDLTERIDKAEGKPVLDKSKASEIRIAYYNLHKEYFENYDLTTDDISLRYYGEYNDSYVMFVDAGLIYTDAFEKDTIDGISFQYYNGQKLEVYSDGDFYSLKQAFEKGLLSHDDLVDISYKLENKLYTKK